MFLQSSDLKSPKTYFSTPLETYLFCVLCGNSTTVLNIHVLVRQLLFAPVLVFSEAREWRWVVPKRARAQHEERFTVRHARVVGTLIRESAGL